MNRSTALFAASLLSPALAWAQALVVDGNAEALVAWGTEVVKHNASAIEAGPVPLEVDEFTYAHSVAGDHLATGFGSGRARHGSIAGLVTATTYSDVGASAESHLLVHAADDVTFHRADLAGQSGSVTVAFRTGGTLDVRANEGDFAAASASITTAFGNAWEQSHAAATDHGDRTEVTPWGPDVVLLTTDFIWGETFHTFLESYASAWTRSEASAAHAGAYGLNATWAGIVSASAAGVAVSGFTVSSLSGFDYSGRYLAAPVPEAPTALTMLAGAALVAAAMRRRAIT